MKTNRRNFLRNGALLGAAGSIYSPFTEANTLENKSFKEPARTISIVDKTDVIVCGAGPAGVTAAIAAARAGANVRLFEAHGSLGGVWTNSLLGYLIDFDKPGFNQELVRKLTERYALTGEKRWKPGKSFSAPIQGLAYHSEEMKLLLEEFCMEVGVKVQYHTRVVAAYKQGRQLTTIVTESKSGRQAWQAPVFVDTTGDGDLGALAGCEFEIGVEKECPCQPLSLNCLILVKDINQLRNMVHGGMTSSTQFINEGTEDLMREIRRAGVEPSYGRPMFFPVRGNLVSAMMNHEYSINATDAAAVSDATIRARAEMNQIIKGLRRLGGIWEDIQIVASPEQIGIRDGRRIRGRYTVMKDDLVVGIKHDDSVLKSHAPVDVHALKHDQRLNGNADYSLQVQPYDIPMRALIAKDVDGLLMAGRCISGDFIAHSSYRVTGNAVPMGEAAGCLAAIAAKTKRQPHDVPFSDVKPVIEKVRKG